MQAVSSRTLYDWYVDIFHEGGHRYKGQEGTV